MAHSRALTDVVRAALWLDIDPYGNAALDRVLVNFKHNHGPAAKTTKLRIEPTHVLATADEPAVDTARMEWQGDSEIAAGKPGYAQLVSLLAMVGRGKSDQPDRDEAADFLDALFADGEERRARDVYAEADEIGIKSKTLQRAAKRLGIDMVQAQSVSRPCGSRAVGHRMSPLTHVTHGAR